MLRSARQEGSADHVEVLNSNGSRGFVVMENTLFESRPGEKRFDKSSSIFNGSSW